MTEVKKASEITWASKVMARLNLSEEGKVGLFGDKLKRVWEKAIRTKKDEISKLESQLANELIEMDEKLVEITDEYNDAFLGIDVKLIVDNDSRAKYADVFTRNLMSKKNAVISYTQLIEDTKKSYQVKIDELKASIAAYEEFLSNI